MTIALFATRDLPLQAIASALRREGVSVSPHALTPGLKRSDIAAPVDKGILIANGGGLIAVGEQAERVGDLIGKERPLILCYPHTAPSDREVLKECGISEIIAPESWDVEHVGARVLGQLILVGEVAPRRYGALRGGTMKMRELYTHIATLAPLSEPVLIVGETGTGKELVARELHNQSGRKGTYLPINCPEIQPDLISSELFGHEKGAFTGANKARVGLIASAGDGTVFLDEIGELDLQSQAKLLRVLEDRKVRRVGANHFEDVRARIVLATNRNLQESCEEGKFRPDLYERIRGFTVELLPLRERKADIPLLAEHFVDEYNEEYNSSCQLQVGGVDCLFQYDWPGNVRELRAVIRKAAAYSDSAGYISPLILQESIRRPPIKAGRNVVPFDPASDTWRDLLHQAQVIYFRELLSYTNGNREEAVRLSGLSRSQFFEKLKEVSKKTG